MEVKKICGIFAVATMVVSTFFVTSCNSEDDFDFGPDSQYSLAERKMTRAGENNENNNDNTPQKQRSVILDHYVFESISDGPGNSYRGTANFYIDVCKITEKVYDPISKENVDKITYEAVINKEEAHSQNIEVDIVDFTYYKESNTAYCKLNYRVYLDPYDYSEGLNVPHITLERSYNIKDTSN